MSEPIIYKGRGSDDNRDEFIDFINYVFGFNGKKNDFPTLLPKLYKPEYHPCENNYVVTENGKLKAAIGVYPRVLDVLGEKIVSHGIGNVAVHPYSRSKGYMKDLLNKAIEDMIAAGADMSDLGGLRDRYRYFSYESASPVYDFEITPPNMRHIFGNAPMRSFDITEVCEKSDTLDKIIELHGKRLCHAKRGENFLEIAHSWNRKLFAIHENGKFIGYYIGDLDELTLVDNNDFDAVVRQYISMNGSVTLKIPGFDTNILMRAERLSESVSLRNNESYTIFNFKKVISAFFRLKAQTTKLVDGSLSVTINGRAGIERLNLEVRNGVPTVSEALGETELTLEHLEATQFFFAIYNPTRLKYPVAQAWFPLPLFFDTADHV